MNDTGNLPLWDLNPGTITVGFLCLTILIVLLLALTGGRK
jgi:hypothetical protein